MNAPTPLCNGAVLVLFLVCPTVAQEVIGLELETNTFATLSVGTDTNAQALRDLQSRLAPAQGSARPIFVPLTNLVARQLGAPLLPARGPEQLVATSMGSRGDFGPHKVTFDQNLRTPGAVTLRIPGGLELRSHVVGLCYYDMDDWRSVLIARTKDRWGQVLLPNQVVYQDALDNVRADVVYTYTRTSLEQDVILRQQLPDPEDFGLTGANIYLGVVTEFLDPPLPHRNVGQIEVHNPLAAAGKPDVFKFYDETIRFGSMRIVEGKAFTLGNDRDTVPVGKVWQEVGPRRFLVEFTPLQLIARKLAALPRQAGLTPQRELLDFKEMLAGSDRPSNDAIASQPMELSQVRLDAEPGVVMDYLIVNTPLLNIDFAGGAKYGPAAAGQDTDDHWNVFSPSYDPDALADLLWSDLSSSSVGIVVSNATQQGYNPLCSDPMYARFAYPASGGNITATLTNLPSNVYDVFVYATRASDQGSPVIELRRDSTVLGIKATTMWGKDWRSPVWEEHEQYVHFRGVAVTNQPLTLISYPDAAGYATLSGIQVVSSDAVPSDAASPTHLLNVDLNGALGDKVGRAGTGLATNDYWNPHKYAYPYPKVVTATNLKWSDQTTCPATMIIRNGRGAYGFSLPDPMTSTYNYALSGANLTVLFTNLPSGTYDFFFYTCNPFDVDNSIFELWSGDVHWGTKATSVHGDGPSSSTWEIGQQYIRFRDVGVVSNRPVVLHAKKNAGGYANFAGIQVARTGELDTDADSLPDGWEVKWFGDLTQTVTNDADLDGLNNLREHGLALFPTVSDTPAGGWYYWHGEFPYVDDATPRGAYLYANYDTWTWVASWYDGTGWGGAQVEPPNGQEKIHVSANYGAMHQHYFERAAEVMRPGTGDVLYAWVNLDPTYPPSEVMLQWYRLDENGNYSWEQRAYWGANSITWGGNGTASRYYMGSLPASGEWVRLEVPASVVGLEGKIIEGMAFTLYGGRAAWADGGIIKPDLDGDGWEDASEIALTGSLLYTLEGDSDSDSLPDWWEMVHFGGLFQSDADDPDDDGISNLDEFLENTDPKVPNIIGFKVSFSSGYVREPALLGSVSVAAGNPQRWIVLVDQEPSSAGPPSTWASCPPELGQGTTVPLAVNLIDTEGWHTVWVGLSRASPLSQPTWARRRFKLDRTPPTLIITSPSPSATSTNPIAQVLGTCNEPLAGLTYDLEHEGAPVESGLPAFVTTQDESGASFQAYDVDLKEGTNTIIFHAEDRAGNAATATLPVELDTSTVVPVLNVLWPPEGETLVCADQCCILGMVHDPAAWVRATITDELTNSVTRYGYTDSSGRFYIENLPIPDGTSVLTLTATDSSGRTVSVQRSLGRADYTAFLFHGGLSGLDLSLTGGASKRSPTVPDIEGFAVNGAALDSPSPGIWEKAVPLSQHESLLPMHVVLTPATGPPAETVFLFEKYPFVHLGHCSTTESHTYAAPACPFSKTWNTHLLDGLPAEGHQTHAWACGDFSYDGEAILHFPAGRHFWGNPWDWYVDSLYHEGEGGNDYITIPGMVVPVTIPAGKDNGCWKKIYVQGAFWDSHLEWQGEDWSYTFGQDTEASLTLRTGGRPGEQRHFQLHLDLSKVENEIWHNFSGWEWADPCGVRLGNAGTTDQRGIAWVTLSGNAAIDVTPFLDGEIRDRITSIDSSSGSPFAAAEFRVTPVEPFSATVDADNDGQVDITGLDAKLRSQVPGKILMANQGDDDRDGLPNWADFHLDDPTKGFGTLADLLVRVPAVTGAEDFRLRFLYDASDPTAIDFEADPLVPTNGQIRIWKQLWTSPDRSTNYIVPGQPYSLAELGVENPGGGETLWFQVEAVRPSAAMGDIAIKVECSPSAGAPGTFILADEVRLTALGVQLVEAISDTEVVPRTAITDSHPAPYFTNLSVTVGTPQPTTDGTKLVSTIRVQGQIRSSLCNLVPGDEGTLGGVDPIGELADISISLNGEPLVEPNGTLTISKQPSDDPLPSFLKPFETYTDFDIEYTAVEVSTGLNWLRLAASDKVPGVGLTGFAELSFQVSAEYQPPGLTVAQQEALVQQAIPATLDFGTGVTSLAALTPSTAVQFQITVETNLMELTEEWTLPTTLLTNLYVVQETLTESAVLFTNGDAWVVVHRSAQLDSFLQGYGTYPDLVAQVSAPDMGLRDVVVRLRADSTSAGKLRHEYTSASVNFATNAMGDIESLELVARRVGVGALTNTLSRSGSSDTFTNAQTTVTFSVSVETTVASGDPLPFTLSDSTLGLSAEPLTVQPGTEPLAYQTFDAPTSALPEGLDNPGYGAFWGWQFYVNGPPTVISQSEGGDIRVHYVRWEGPDGVLAEQAERSPQHFKLMSDGSYYAAKPNPTHPLACECGCVTPEAHILVATSQKRELPQNFTLTDAGLQHLGFVAGAFAQAVDDAKGVLDFVIMDFQLARKRDRFIKAYISMETGNATAPQLELVVDVGTKAEEVSAFIEGVWDLWLAAEQNQWDRLGAAASGDWEEYNRQSETMRWLNAYMVEFMVAVQNEYAELNSFERGKIQGRITLEAVMIVLPFTKPAQATHLSRVQFLTRLSEVGWIRENEQLLNILTRVIQLAEGKPPVPPIIGLPAVGQKAATVGTEVAGEAERIWGAYAAKVASGKSKNLAAMEAMRDVGANADAMKVAFRFKQMSDVQRAKMPFSPSAAEYDELLTILNWNAVKAKKGILVVENGKTFWVVGGAQGYEGNHIVTKALQEALQGPPYNLPIANPNASPVGILTAADHQYGASAFHKLLDNWKGGIFSDNQIGNIGTREGYETASKVLDEYLKFLKSIEGDPRFADYSKVARGFANKHSISITQ